MSKEKPAPTSQIRVELWNESPRGIVKNLKAFLKKNDDFVPDRFLQLNFHMVKGDVTYEHKVDLCRVADAIAACKKCKFRNTPDCTLSIPRVIDEKVSMATLILRLTEGIELFNCKDRAYAWVCVNEGLDVIAVNSNAFERYVSGLLYQQEGKPPSNEAIASAQNVLTAKAFHEGKMYNLHNRIAWHDDNLWYDLSDKINAAVEIGPEGWSIHEATPIPLFRRYSHQLPSFRPICVELRSPQELREALEVIFRFLNANTEDKDTRLLIMITLVSYFVEGIAHPIILLHGAQGSAKSTFGKVFKRLVDNSIIPIMGFPKGRDNLIQALDHHWYAVFDNVTAVHEWQSDILCRAVTGEGMQSRKLYSDDDVIIREYQRCLTLNGINIVASKPDLLDRSLLFHLPRVEEENRQAEKTFWDSFEVEAPGLLGTIFDILSRAMQVYPTIETTGLYRLADWTIWGCAICRALGIDDNDFLQAYGINRAKLNEEAVAIDVVGTVLIAFMQDKFEWIGTATELKDDLTRKAEEMKVSTTSKEWPDAANSLSRKLKVLETNLRDLGFYIKWNRVKKGRYMTITQRASENTVTSVISSPRSLEHYFTASSSDLKHVEGDDIGDDTTISSSEVPLPRIDSKSSNVQLEAKGDGDDDGDDINDIHGGGYPKDPMRGIKSKGDISPLILAYEERWETFLERTATLDHPLINEFDLDKLYVDEEKGQLHQDLKDWISDGRLWKNFNRGVEGWRVTDRGAPDE